MIESDTEFLARMKLKLAHNEHQMILTEKEDIDRLFSLAHIGAALRWKPIATAERVTGFIRYTDDCILLTANAASWKSEPGVTHWLPKSALPKPRALAIQPHCEICDEPEEAWCSYCHLSGEPQPKPGGV